MTIKVGIWGAGFMGGTHARILGKDPRVTLWGVFDIDGQRSQRAALELQCRAASSVEELLENVDAVYITVPNTLHALSVEKAIEYGRHIYCEKPFATSLDDARRIRERLRSYKPVFEVGHNRRFAPVYQTVKRFLEESGDPATLAQFKMNRGELESPVWVGQASVTGGYLFETPVHLLDMARWLLGEVVELGGLGRACTYGEYDNFSLLARMESGLSLTFTSCAHASWAFPYERIEIYGRHWTVETAEMERVSVTQGIGHSTRVEDFHALPNERKLGYAGIDANFVSAVLGEEEPAVTAADGYRSVELVDRWYRAAGFFS